MAAEKVEFKGENGNTLRGILHLSNKPGSPFALFAHCFTCSKDLKAISTLSKRLAQKGISVLRFDFTGLGESEGEFSDTGFSTNVGDIVSAAGFLEKNYSPVDILIGHSLGGAAVLQSSEHIPSAKAVVTIASPSEPSHVKKILKTGIEEISRTGEGVVNIAGRSFRIKKEFLDDLESHSMERKITNLRKALLVMHSPIDNIVGIDNATAIFVPAKHPKSFISLDNADHLLSRRNDAEYAAEVIASWSERYIKSPGDGATSSSGQGDVEVVNGKFGYTTYISVNGHEMTVDEPVNLGGDDLGADPYSYLLGALGSCTAITIRMYSERKNWRLENIRIVLNHEKIHASDCAECETAEGKVDRIDRKIILEGDLSEEQKSRLLEIADKCPVHKSLKSEISIRTFAD